MLLLTYISTNKQPMIIFCINYLLVHRPWGEHEIDYVLFATVPSKDVLTIQPHPDEVDDVKWVSQSQLLQMFNDSTLLFSPWFRLITKKWMIGGGSVVEEGGGTGGGGGGWWDDLERTMKTDDFCDYGTIHRFDPPMEHMGGGGDAGPWLEDDEGKSNGVAAAAVVVGDSS